MAVKFAFIRYVCICVCIILEEARSWAGFSIRKYIVSTWHTVSHYVIPIYFASFLYFELWRFCDVYILKSQSRSPFRFFNLDFRLMLVLLLLLAHLFLLVFCSFFSSSILMWFSTPFCTFFFSLSIWFVDVIWLWKWGFSRTTEYMVKETIDIAHTHTDTHQTKD